VTTLSHNRTSGFTLVEVLVGMTLSLIVMAGVLSGYVFLGRNFTRSLGLSSANEPTLESQGRRALAYFVQDVRMASGVDLTGVAPSVVPSASGVTLVLPAAAGKKLITYLFNNTNAPVVFDAYTLPAQSLVRIDQSAGTALTLHTNLLTVYFRYFDSSARPYDNTLEPYTTATTYLSGIKQLSLTLTSQAGNPVNGTQTPVYVTTSPLLILRNKPLLP